MKTRKPHKYWQDKENCRFEASNHQTMTSFAKYSSHGYNVARVNGWLDEICSHMRKIGNRHNKSIYSCEFSDNYVYVGLTYNFEERKLDHLNMNREKKSSVIKHIIKTGLIPQIIKLTNYIPVGEAIILENKYLNKYKKEGWYILNLIKTGGIGGSVIKWNRLNCQSEALKYKTRNQFRVNSSGAYDAAHKHGWLNEITEHMLIYRKYEGYWIKENCQEEALKYKTRTDFARNSSGAYDAAWRNKWLGDVCKHM